MTIKDLKLSKYMLETISDFKYEIGNKVRETGVKFIHCGSEDFDRIYKPIFLEYGFKIFKSYWSEFDIEKSAYPNKELYLTLRSLNSGAELHYFHNSILLKITDLIIKSVIIGDEEYLYKFDDVVNYDSQGIYINQYRNLYYQLSNDEEIESSVNTISKMVSKLTDRMSHGSFLLKDISKAAYYEIVNKRFLDDVLKKMDDEIL